MSVMINLYSDKYDEIQNFLNSFYNSTVKCENKFKWEESFENPSEIADIIGTLIENNDIYKINMWVSFDKNIFINITENNVDKIIRYIFERFPY